MPLSILVRLRHGSYEAGGERPSNAEWPPHPARLFCALVASAESEADWSALRWLEAQPPPEVWADGLDTTQRGRTRAYVVENAISQKGGNLTWPGRNNGMRSRSFAVPSTESFAVVWPEADLDAQRRTIIARMAGKVPYVGRSAGAAEVSVSASVPERMSSWVTYSPAKLGEGRAAWLLRVPYVGYTRELESAYDDGRRAWEVARVLPYEPVRTRGTETSDGRAVASAGPFEDLMVWSLRRPVVRIGGDNVLRLTAALRRAVLSRVPDPVPAQISGHGADGRPHVGYLALPDVGYEHSDGHVLGLALAIPKELGSPDVSQLVKAVMTDPLNRIRLLRDQTIDLEYGADLYGAQPERWATRGGARTWVSATPLMPDGYVRKGRDLETVVARSLRLAGYPDELTAIEVSDMPLVRGAIWRPRKGTVPEGRPHRRLVHAKITFAKPVLGPVIAGSLRYLGLGLFLPADARPGARSGADEAIELAGAQL